MLDESASASKSYKLAPSGSTIESKDSKFENESTCLSASKYNKTKVATHSVTSTRVLANKVTTNMKTIGI